MFKGIIPALYTFFKREGKEIDFENIFKLVDFLIRKRVNGIFICGTTGSSVLLNNKEKVKIIKKVIRNVNNRIPVIVNVGTATTDESVYLTDIAKRNGADAISTTPPYYFKYDDICLEKFFTKIARTAKPLPLILYNFPQNTNNIISDKVIKMLLLHEDNIIGIKDSSGSIEQIKKYINIDERFTVMCGSDPLFLRALKYGAKGTTSSTANFLPELFTFLYNSYFEGDFKSAERAQEDITYTVKELNEYCPISFYNEAFKYRHIYGKSVRKPFRLLNNIEKKRVKNLFNYLNRNWELK